MDVAYDQYWELYLLSLKSEQYKVDSLIVVPYGDQVRNPVGQMKHKEVVKL
jgi:hypothetical protein